MKEERGKKYRRETVKAVLGLSEDYSQLFGHHPQLLSGCGEWGFQRVVNGKLELSTNRHFKALFL